MGQASTNLVIHTEHLTKRYGDIVAVDNLSFSVQAGGVFGLLGPNGSGKTTTIGMVLGLVQPSGGFVRLFDNPHSGAGRPDLRRIGAIVESPTFYPYLSGRANLRYFQAIGSHGGFDEIARLLKLVDLTDAADRPYHTYSLGMKQRLGIAYALLGDPDLLFLDEPTNGLDPAGVAEVRDLIRSLGAGGRTIILSSHLLGEVQQVCERVAILSHGRLLVQGNVDDLLRTNGVVRLDTTDNAAAARILVNLPFVERVQQDDGNLLVNVAADHSWELTRALALDGIYVAELSLAQISLERYFLEITGERTHELQGEVA